MLPYINTLHSVGDDSVTVTTTAGIGVFVFVVAVD